MNFVIFVNAAVLLFFSGLMVINAIVFPASRLDFLESALFCATLGTIFVIATINRFGEVRRKHQFLMTVTVWLTAAFAGALPLWHYRLDAVDALFESMSAITTTGSTVMSGLDTTARGILFWRALLQGLGGIGFIVMGIALLPMLRVGGMQLFRTESSDKGDKEFSTATGFATNTLGVYLSLMALCAIGYSIGGMSPFDAITHAMTTLSTGGYSNYDSSFGHFDSAYLQWQATLFMLAGGLPFAWYIRVYHRRVFRSDQVQLMVSTLVVTIGGLTLWHVFENGTAFFEALRMVAFNVVSVVTTTGYATTDYTTWGAFATVAFFVLTATGGCTGSTSGGLKAMRIIIGTRAAVARIKRILQPHAITHVRYEGRIVGEDVLSGVIGFIFFYFATFFALALALNFVGLDFATSISGALTAIANVGPGVGTVIGPAGNFVTLNEPAKILIFFGMFAGRLEMLTIFVLLTPRFWRDS
ncbi:Trk system potassium uptake protein TrkG [Aquimixticola soesokkakensis]|uniref:Trk system potassium uptake protein n=1 Tax=Aquimixticola soesokkakensis TaxID=1519096 RepID=A0A1Y5SD84_9RHOB|nr:TrkH family potassium uptake protein [Aquimixticola soesokkakensis]SLN34970.1 Trk system potassium uptake protein TrkG [Aquimixticola soesokkakensis]